MKEMDQKYQELLEKCNSNTEEIKVTDAKSIKDDKDLEARMLAKFDDRRGKISDKIPFSESFESSTEKTGSNVIKSGTALPALVGGFGSPSKHSIHSGVDGEQLK